MEDGILAALNPASSWGKRCGTSCEPHQQVAFWPRRPAVSLGGMFFVIVVIVVVVFVVLVAAWS